MIRHFSIAHMHRCGRIFSGRSVYLPSLQKPFSPFWRRTRRRLRYLAEHASFPFRALILFWHVLRELLRQHHVFCTTVLLGMSQTVDPGSSSLQVLRQDPETSIAYKRLIADYLHIPIGETLLRAQKAHHNLTTAIDERVENFVSLEDINFWVDQINNDNAGDSDSDSGGFGLDLEFNL